MLSTKNTPAQSLNEPSTILYAKEFCYCGNDLFPEFQDKIPILIHGCIVACDAAFSKKEEYFANIDWIEANGQDITALFYQLFPPDCYNNIADDLYANKERQRRLFLSSQKKLPIKVKVQRLKYLINNNTFEIEYYIGTVKMRDNHSFVSIKDFYINAERATLIAASIDDSKASVFELAYDVVEGEIEGSLDWTETVTGIFNNIVNEAQRQGLIKIAA